MKEKSNAHSRTFLSHVSLLRRSRKRFYCTALLALLCLNIGAGADEPILPATELKKLSLDELFNQEITTVSKHSERLAAAASAIEVITQEDIRRSGATSLPEALRLAPNLTIAQVDSRQWSISSRGSSSTAA